MERKIASLEELEREANDFVGRLSVSEEQATLVTLSGELGAGKTAFTKVVAKALGVNDSVTSPTFVLEKIYALPPNKTGFSNLVHIDAYRLKNGTELGALGFDEVMSNSRNLVILEWPQLVQDKLHKPTVNISLVAHEDGSRTIFYE